MVPAAKNILKASLGVENLRLMSITKEAVVAMNANSMVIVFNAEGFPREGFYSKDFEKVDTEEEYEYPNWKHYFPKGEPVETVVLNGIREIVYDISKHHRTFDLHFISKLPAESEANLLYYEEAVLIYYPMMEMTVVVNTRDIEEGLGMKSGYGNSVSVIDDIKDRRKENDNGFQLSMFEDIGDE